MYTPNIPVKMNTKLYTDEELYEFASMPKRVINPRAQWIEKPRRKPVHRQKGYKAVDQQGDGHHFSIYLRQNLVDDCDFSCGISYLPRDGQPLTLARYNGPSHIHGDISYRPHIHRASEKAIVAGKKPDSEAEETERYDTLNGALACLVEDYHLSGIDTQEDNQRLFR